MPCCQRHERHDTLAFEIVGPADDRGFGHGGVADQGALHFHGSDAMSGDIDDIVDPSHDPEITVFVTPRTVAGEVHAFEYRSSIVSCSAPGSPYIVRIIEGQGLFTTRNPPSFDADGIARSVHDVRDDSRQRARRRSGFRQGLAPGTGAIMIAPVSVCHHVSTIGHRSPPMCLRYHIHASGLMGSPTVPSSRRLERSCLAGHSSPHLMKARMAVGAV